MQEKQEFKAVVTLPKALSPEQIERLKTAFRVDLISSLGGDEYLREHNIDVVVMNEIQESVSLG